MSETTPPGAAPAPPDLERMLLNWAQLAKGLGLARFNGEISDYDDELASLMVRVATETLAWHDDPNRRDRGSKPGCEPEKTPEAQARVAAEPAAPAPAGPAAEGEAALARAWMNALGKMLGVEMLGSVEHVAHLIMSKAQAQEPAPAPDRLRLALDDLDAARLENARLREQVEALTEERDQARRDADNEDARLAMAVESLEHIRKITDDISPTGALAHRCNELADAALGRLSTAPAARKGDADG